MRTIKISLLIYLGRRMRMKIEMRMTSSLTGRTTKRRKKNVKMMKMGLTRMPKI